MDCARKDVFPTSCIHLAKNKSAICVYTPLAECTGGKTPAPLDNATLDALAAQLPDQLRVAFVLHDREGLSDGAIAAHLRIEQREVRRLVHVARLELRRLWHEQQPGGDR